MWPPCSHRICGLCVVQVTIKPQPLEPSLVQPCDDALPTALTSDHSFEVCFLVCMLMCWLLRCLWGECEVARTSAVLTCTSEFVFRRLWALLVVCWSPQVTVVIDNALPCPFPCNHIRLEFVCVPPTFRVDSYRSRTASEDRPRSTSAVTHASLEAFTPGQLAVPPRARPGLVCLVGMFGLGMANHNTRFVVDPQVCVSCVSVVSILCACVRECVDDDLSLSGIALPLLCVRAQSAAGGSPGPVGDGTDQCRMCGSGQVCLRGSGWSHEMQAGSGSHGPPQLAPPPVAQGWFAQSTLSSMCSDPADRAAKVRGNNMVGRGCCRRLCAILRPASLGFIRACCCCCCC